MRALLKAGACALAIVSATQASAATFLVTFAGTLQAPHTYNSANQEIATPNSTIKAGDAVNISFYIDTSSTTGYFAGGPTSDPTVANYSGDNQNLSMQVGSYFYNSYPPFGGFAQHIVWNDHVMAGNQKVDYLGTSFLGTPGNASPVEHYFDFSVDFNAFDFTGTARNSTSFNEQPSLSRYATQALAITFSDYYIVAAQQKTVFNVALSSATITAVPEPATWAMMIAGFGMAGVALRRRRRAIKAWG